MLKINKQKYIFLESLNKSITLHGKKNLEKAKWGEYKSRNFQVTLKKEKKTQL